jgi:predicted nucleotidyltransferase
MPLSALEPAEEHWRMRMHARQTALGYAHDAGVVGYEAVVFGSSANTSRHVA